MSWPHTVVLGRPFVVKTAWANAGVAPCYPGGFWAFTLKDNQGGIVSVNVDEHFDLRQLQVEPPGQPPQKNLDSPFTIAFRHVDPRGTFIPATQAGTYDVYVSVGQRDGTPRLALPLANSDGQRRYKLGQIQVADGTEKPAGE